MKRWNNKQSKEVENSKVNAFLNEIADVCRKHELAISHEDNHGAFEIVNIGKGDIDWILNASDNTGA